ncbi:CAP domain-containing protein [Alteromonas sp. ASW11-19]|uniref:CAP domain-containing protein n=1 Tax=Alteromonas salexigens TaxID=2982530 RepID=A0ABT2VLW6_9ALTE|nr:CAP domain-containing protein [Alteromonas salexigens]MCU7554049.1 CAP domain-containing protein [Alteromonas salexigens]
MCGSTEQAQQLALAIMTDELQQRKEIRCNGLLQVLAEEKARLMAERGMVFHNLDGSPNSRLRNAGFELPDYYGAAFSNQVEAIAGGYATVEKVWRSFKKSKDHADHLLGRLPFYREQDEMGVAFVSDRTAPHVEYWVVYLTKGKTENQHRYFDTIPNKGTDMLFEDMPGG